MSTTMTHRQARDTAMLRIITRALEGLVPSVPPANLMVHFEERSPLGAGTQVRCLWHGSIPKLAEIIHLALYGRPREAAEQTEPGSPLEQAAAAKGARDLHGEIAALMGGAQDLEEQPWYPPRPGDLVHLTYDAYDRTPRTGETYVITRTQVEGMPDGFMDMSLLHATHPDSPHVGCYASSCNDDPLMEVWMEAGRHCITVVRDGVVVHNGPAATGR